MRPFDYENLARRKWDMDILNLVSKIQECKGRQDLFTRQKPVELERLQQIARIQSTESSNRIEGIVSSSTRMKQLMDEKTTPANRDESEIVGYRDVLGIIHENYEQIPIKRNYILQLHRDLFRHTDVSFGGHFKNVQNYINEYRPDGTAVTRFTPTAPYETPSAIDAICESYNRTIAFQRVDPLILIPVFILDFLCIHPFNDGNGRMSRLLTLLLMYQNGFEVGKYISIEKAIEKTKDRYYDVLNYSDVGWDDASNDPDPFIRYMLEVILSCYKEFEEKVRITSYMDKRTQAYDIVKVYVSDHIGKFSISDVLIACPGISRASAQKALKQMVENGTLEKHGASRGTYYLPVLK